MSSRGGIRVTTADAYLPADGTPANLTIRPGAHVAEVDFQHTRATGMQLAAGGARNGSGLGRAVRGDLRQSRS